MAIRENDSQPAIQGPQDRQRTQLRADEITMADLFEHNGSATGLFSKGHLGDTDAFE